jgi:predicted TIM-barrel fold metal-dependent hydrolase
MQVVDPHIHLWDLKKNYYPWLAKPGVNFLGDYSSLAKSHLPADFRREAGDIEVLKVVHVDAGHNPADPLRETQWLQGLADAPGGGGFPQAIVAAADFSRPDVGALLEAHARHPNLRGVRQILNVHADPIYDYVSRNFMEEPEWRANFRLLAKHRLSFDLQIYPDQAETAAALAHENPDIPFILNHTGMFADRGSWRAWRIWTSGLRRLAAEPNVAIKISGLGMFDPAWTLESFRPYVLEAIAAFGVARAMFASNFPVDRLFSSYPRLWRSFEAIVADADEAERAALFRGNAERIYRL